MIDARNINDLAARIKHLGMGIQSGQIEGTAQNVMHLMHLKEELQKARAMQNSAMANAPKPPTVMNQVASSAVQDADQAQAQSVQDMMKQRALAMQGEMAGTGGLGSFVREPEKKMALGGAVAFSGENYSYVDPAIIKKYLTEAARKYNLNPDQLIAQANAESSLNPMATNPNSTAAGMGQFTEGTWKDWGTSNPNDRFNPKLAAEAMAKYNRANIDKWGGDLQKGYASYHLGPNADPEKLANDTAYTSKILGQNAPDGLSVPQLTYSQPTKLTDYASQMEISPAGNPEEERAAIEKYLGPNKGIESLRSEISKMKEESASDKNKALGMALMQAGFGAMAGTSPYAMANIGQGAMKGLDAYTDSLKDYKKEQSRLVELQARADDADRQEAWNKFKYGEESAKAKTATHRADTLAKQTAQQKTEADQAKLNLETKKSDIDAYTAQSTNAYHQGIINTRGGETNLSDYEGFKNTLLANPQSAPELFKTVDGKLVLDEIKAHNAFTNRKSNIQLSDLNTLMQNINDPNDPLYRAAYEQAQGIVGPALKQDYGLAVGTKKNGYTYMGGNPNSKSSWRED